MVINQTEVRMAHGNRMNVNHKIVIAIPNIQPKLFSSCNANHHSINFPTNIYGYVNELRFTGLLLKNLWFDKNVQTEPFSMPLTRSLSSRS